MLIFASGIMLAAPAFAANPIFIIHAPASVQSSSASGESYNWSGYEATGGTFTGIGATWVIPTIAATSSLSADATWVGIGGVASHDLVQVGTQALTGNAGTPLAYEAWIETLPQSTNQIPLTVHAGDSITASLNEVGTNLWQIAMTDNTTGQDYVTQVSYASSLSSAEWIEEAPTDQDGILPIDNFNSVSFSSAYAIENGGRVTILGSNASPLTIINAGGQALVAPGALNSDGAGFAVTRTLASPTAVGSPGLMNVRGRGRRVGVGIQGFIPRRLQTQSGTVPSAIPASASNPSAFTRNFGNGNFRIVLTLGSGQQFQILRMLQEKFLKKQ